MAEKRTSGVKRVHRAKDKEDLIVALTSEHVGVFKEIWRLLLFAAQIGFQEKRREPLGPVDSGKGIDQSTFGNCPSWPGVSYLLALVENGTSDSLSGAPEAEDSRLDVFQEYANGGLAVLREHFQDRIIDLDSVISFIDMRSRTVNQDPDLELSI
jgi:dnd system-associated protein 4